MLLLPFSSLVSLVDPVDHYLKRIAILSAAEIDFFLFPPIVLAHFPEYRENQNRGNGINIFLTKKTKLQIGKRRALPVNHKSNFQIGTSLPAIRKIESLRRENNTMDFSIVVEGYERMTKTSSRTELTLILVDILKNTPTKLLPQVSYLTQGKLYPDFEGIEIGMAEKMVARAIEKAYGSELQPLSTCCENRETSATLQPFFQKKNHNSCFPPRNSASKKSSRLSTKLQELQDQAPHR